MSDYQPKVGDRVMVGEHGPYTVHGVGPDSYVQVHVGGHTYTCRSAFPEWLTPAPEPEPDEPTAYGALVRDGDGRTWIHNPVEVAPDTPAWDAKDRLSRRWADIPRPITVVLGDPADVEALMEERDHLRERVAEERGLGADEKRRADELQRRIDKVIAYCDDPGNWRTYEGRRWLISRWLRDES